MTETIVKTEQAFNTGRFKIGQRIVAMRYLIEGRRLGFSNPTFLPWEDRLTNKGVELVLLTVKEHHKVAWNQDPEGEKKYDGYVLEDQKGRRWTNQYPRASYGQLSDDADWHFRLQFPDGVDFKTLTDLEMASFEDVCQVVSRVSRGIRYFSTPTASMERYTPEDFATMKLIDHRDWLFKKIEHEFGCKIEEKPIWKDSPNIAHPVLHWPGE